MVQLQAAMRTPTPFNRAVRSNDPFEVCFIADTLIQPGHLGHLIFGPQLWTELYPISPDNEHDDPLTEYFYEHRNSFQGKDISIV